MIPEAPKKLVDWSIVVAAVTGCLLLIIALLALFNTQEQTTGYVHRFLHQSVLVWKPIVVALLLVFCYSLYKRLMKKPSVSSQENALLSTGKVVQYGSKIALLTFNHRFVQVDMDDPERRLKVTDRDKAAKWEEFSLSDPNDNTSTRQLKYGDKISLIGMDHKYMAADLNDNSAGFVYSSRTEYLKNNWGKFTVEALSTKTNMREGDDVLYGHPVALKANNGDYLAYRQNQVDQLLWVAAKEVGAWEQFTFVTYP